VLRETWKQKVDFLLAERRRIVDHERFVEYLANGGYKEFDAAVKRIAPDVILVDNGLHTYWALMARHTGIPCIRSSALLPLEYDPVVPPLNSLLQPATDFRSRARVRFAWESFFASRWLRAKIMGLAGIPDSIANFRRLARATGCPRHSFNARSLLFPQIDFPLMIACPAEFEFPEALGRPNVEYVEALIDPNRPEPDFPWEQLLPDKRLIFCSLGSVAWNRHFFQNVLDAFSSEHDWQLVMNVGSAISPSERERVPPTAILVNGAPQLGLLRRASAMINHAGINSVRECLYFGVPQLAFPLFFDQNGAAARIARHRLGLVGSLAEASPERLRFLVRQLLEDAGIHRAARAMSEAFQARETESSAAKFVERHLKLTLSHAGMGPL